MMIECDNCGETIQGSYFQHEGRNICARDYEAKYRKKCFVCGENISGSYFTDPNGKIMCAKDYKKKQGGSLACRVCGKEIVAGGEIVRALESLFHPNCFKCSVCGKNLSDDDDEGGFNSDEQKNLYCRDDYHKKFAPRCHGCSQLIMPKGGETTAKRLKAFDKNWHPECFKCADCRERLGVGYKACYPKDQTPLCKDCHIARPP